MNLYELPKFNFLSRINTRRKGLALLASAVFLSIIFGFLAGAFSSAVFYFQIRDYLAKMNVELPAIKETVKEYLPQTSQEEKVIKVVADVSPAVVSIVVTKDLPIIEQYFEPGPFGLQIPQYRQKGTEKQEIGGGSGFIVSSDGLVLTNKHVVLDQEADYTVLTNDGQKFPAKVLARDPVEDLAVLKIEPPSSTSFPTVNLGDSDNLESGQTVIAIGNALGEFRNTISAGVISGLGRKITASGGGLVETLEDVIQTDAAINKGNSGGPLLNLKGEVIGINTAMVLEAQSIGFAIPVNKVKRAIEQVRQSGKIVYPFLGIRYLLVDQKVKDQYNLSVDYGALIIKGESDEKGVEPGSAADKAGLKEGDVVLEFNGEKITTENTLAKIIIKYQPGDEVVLKILREEKEMEAEAILGERSE